MANQTIYAYSAQTGEFTGRAKASPSPLEPGKYLVPAFATTIAPPDAGDHQVAVFDGGWVLREDWRGLARYKIADGSRIEVSKIGSLADVAPETTELEPPVAPEGQRTVWTGEAWNFEDLPPTPPPEKVTMRQTQLALLDAGLLDEVEALIAGMEGAQGRAAQIEWKSAHDVERANPLFTFIAAQLNLSAERLDELFVEAAKK
ncbi:MAG: hypothetical protein LBL69_04935 [Zoogloeaceae bacterium]|nr:hypothetical protein [Zoogloeaceae bacterium]